MARAHGVRSRFRPHLGIKSYIMREPKLSVCYLQKSKTLYMGMEMAFIPPH